MGVAKPIAIGLSIMLAAVFGLAGTVKLTPMISPAAHSHLASEFNRYLIALQLDRIGLDAVAFRTAVGVTEAFSAVSLLLPGLISFLGVITLKIVMIGAIYTHAMLSEPVIVPVVLLGLLFALSTLKTKLRTAPATVGPAQRKKKST